jgi:hypothetical protein
MSSQALQLSCKPPKMGVAVTEGCESWRDESYCTAPVVAGETCEDDCCH